MTECSNFAGWHFTNSWPTNCLTVIPSKQEKVLILAEDGTVDGLVPSEDAGEGSAPFGHPGSGPGQLPLPPGTLPT